MLRKIFGRKNDKLSDKLRTLYKEEFCGLYKSPGVI
jgi:hypothetical protein